MNTRLEKNIFLVGFMGTGKTTVGKILAQRLEYQFFDIDASIEDQERRTIAAIFQQQGEVYFRLLEKKLLFSMDGKTRVVVSCGGGIILDRENRNFINTRGISVCLSATVETICNRLKNSVDRPLLAVENPQEKIHQLLAERHEFYSQVPIQIDTTYLSAEQVAETIIEAALL